MCEKLWPSTGTNSSSFDEPTETENASQDSQHKRSSSEATSSPSSPIRKSFTESFFEKLALTEYETSIYSQLSCATILASFYRKIVASEMKLIRNNKVNTIIRIPLIRTPDDNENAATISNTYKSINKKLSLNILDFGKFYV